MRKIIPILLIVLSLIIAFNSCTKEYFEQDKMRQEKWVDINMQTPLINTTLVLRDILKDYDKDELFEVDKDGFLSLMYNTTAFSRYAGDIIVLDDFDLPTDVLQSDNISGGNKIISNNFDFSSFPGAQIDSILYDSVVVSITVSNNISTTGDLTIQFPDLKKDGSMAQMFITNLSGTTTQLLVGYELDLTNGTSSQWNNINYNYVFNNWVGSTGQTVDVNVSLKNQDYKRINGYIGKHDIDLPEEAVLINIFKQHFEGEFYFHDPKVKLTMHNSFGLPIKLNVDSVYGKDYDNNMLSAFDINYEKNPVNYPNIKGDIVRDSSLIDNEPWLRALISDHPKHMYFQSKGEINPTSTIDHGNFILDSSKFELNAKFIIPLWGRAEYPTIVDTSELDMDEHFEDLESLTYMKLRFDINNGLPVQIGIQAYFVDSSNVVLDSLFKSTDEWIFVEGGKTDVNGKVNKHTSKVTDIIYDKTKINKLEDVEKIIYHVVLKTDELVSGKLVRFYAEDNIGIKMGIHAKGGSNLEPDNNEDE